MPCIANKKTTLENQGEFQQDTIPFLKDALRIKN